MFGALNLKAGSVPETLIRIRKLHHPHESAQLKGKLRPKRKVCAMAIVLWDAHIIGRNLTSPKRDKFEFSIGS